MKEIGVQILDFSELARAPDEEVIRRMVFTCQTAKLKLVPKSVQPNRFRVSRKSDRLTIRLLTADGDRETEVGRFHFLPPTDFSQRPVQL